MAGLLPAVAAAQVIINPAGGTGPGTGVRVHVGPTGQVQVIRNGAGQFYSQTATPGATTNPGVSTGLSNGVYLAVGTTNVFGPLHFAATPAVGVTAAEFTPISNTLTPQPSGSGSATTVLRATVAGRNYDLSVRYDYVFPNDFVSVTHTLTIPAGNTAPVRLYHALDAYLGGDDNGPNFFVQGPPTVVGGFREASNVVLAWRYRNGVPWTGYYGGFYECMFRDLLCPMGSGGGNNVLSAVTFNNWVDSTVQDNGFAIMWNFGSAPATQVVSNDLTFFSYQPTLTKAFGTTAISAGSSTTLTFTIDNVPGAPAQGNLGFLDTLPANLLLANGTFTNTCGGTVTLVQTGTHSIRLQNGALAPLTARCTLTVNVTATVPGAYVNGRTNLSALSVVENQVSDQTLSVVQSAPVVILDAPGIINLANATAYPVSGSCQATAGMVTVTVGSVVVSTGCTAGTFSTSVNAAGVPDGPTVMVSASQTNFAGTGTASRATSKDTTSPSAPVFTSPAEGAFSNTATPTFSGTAEPGTTVRIVSGGVTVCTALTQGTGVWTCTTSSLVDGARTFTTTATDPAGNASSNSGPRGLTIDTTAPVAPVISSPAMGATVGPNPTISGTAEPFASVTVTEGAGTVCTVSANNLGQWSCPTTFGPSSRTLSATQRDRANNASPAAANRTFTIANVPTVTVTTPGPITAANASAYTVAGTCTSSAGTVTIAVGTVMSTTPCTGAGTFSLAVNASGLGDGPTIAVSAAQTNVTGTGTDTRSTRKDTVAPAAPSLTSPAEGERLNTSTPTITGTAEANATLVVRRGASTLCTVTVPTNGLFSCVSTALPEGGSTITATATDVVGNASPASPARSFTVDTSTPSAPVITNPAQSATVGINPTLAGTAEPGATVSVSAGALLVCSVTANASGQWSCPTSYQPGTHSISATQRDVSGNVSPPSTARQFTVASVPSVTLDVPTPINQANAASFPVTGRCTVGAGQVSVQVGTVNASAACAAGTFSTTVVASALSDGPAVAIVASQTNASGTGSDTRSTQKDTVAPAAPTFTRPADASVSSDTTPTITGSAEAGSTVQVSRGTLVLCTTVAPANGLFSCVSSALGDGQVSITATATDVAGNPSAPSTARTFVVDTTPPDAPAIAAPSENAKTGLSPMLSGTAEPLATVTVREGAVIVCQVVASALGQWTCPTALGAGSHGVTATQTDRAGNQGPASSARTFVVEGAPTVLLSALEPINKARAPAYAISGFCTTSAGPVTIAVGAVMGTPACVAGLFTASLNVTSLADGPMIEVSASQTSAAGTTTDRKTVLKDTLAPSAPTFATPTENGLVTMRRPLISGTAEPGSTVRVSINGQLAGTTTADAQGRWSITPTADLADARQTLTATATDAVGNESDPSMVATFVVDASAPNVPVIITPEAGATLDRDRAFDITGQSEPGAKVRLFLDGVETITVTADDRGRFVARVSANVLAEGAHVVSAEATDAASNRSARAVDVPFVIRVPVVRYGGMGCTAAPVEAFGLLGLIALALRRRWVR